MLHSNFGRLTPFLFTVMASAALAQVPGESVVRSDAARPVIGLVLSGGGARGGAHVGVLRALEELGVPVDVVAGTSIGAIIGGFYASGLSVNEIATLTETIDWDAAFLEDAPRELISFRRKREDDLFLVDQKPGLSDGELKLPLGAVQGQVIDLILTEQTLPVSYIDDFDELPIPFRAVATDLATGETVVMDSGNLAASIRASMSVPAVLSPIDIDGRLLVDGGVTMNLPVEVAQQMGADILVAVDISSPMLAREELTSVLDVTTQLTHILMRRGIDDQLEKLGPNDLLITPEFGDEFSSAGFSQMAAAIDAGYDAAMSIAPALSAYAIAPADYATHLTSIAGPEPEAAPTVDFIRLRNGAAISDAVIERQLRGIEIGEPLDLMAVEEAVNKIYGLELYQNVRYVLVEDGDQMGLEFRLDEQAWGPNYVQFGLGYSTAGEQDALFGVAASYVGKQLNENNGEWRATVALGDQPGVFTDLHQPFGRNNSFFVAPSFSLRSELYNVFDNGMRVTELHLDRATAEVALGQELGAWGEIRAGLRRTTGRVEVEVGEPDRIPEGDFDDGQFFARFSVDTLDSLAFPTSGSIMGLEWRGASQGQIGANVDYEQVSLEGAYAKTWDRYTLLARLRYDTTVSGAAPINGFYRLGGFLDLSGLNQNELIGQNVARVGAVLYRRINNLAFLPAFAGVSLEMGNVWEQRSDISSGDSLLGGSVWVGVDTPIGPVYAAYGRAEDDRDAFYLFLGRIF